MKMVLSTLMIILSSLTLIGCNGEVKSQNTHDSRIVEKQQRQLAIAQPIPLYDYSLERDLLKQLYDVRNRTVGTHSVWRSNTGMIEGDCPSIGFGLPYDTSLTNPLAALELDTYGTKYPEFVIPVGQPEPNGIFASTNTSATWVFCASKTGSIEPIYVESKVTTYPYRVAVDYNNNRVSKFGKSNVNLKVK